MGSISLHRLNEIGDEVVSLLTLDIDIRPRRLHRISEPDESVIDGNDDQYKDDNNSKNDEDSYHRTSYDLREKCILRPATWTISPSCNLYRVEMASPFIFISFPLAGLMK